MTIKELKEMVMDIPECFDEYEVVYSVATMEEDTELIYRKDQPIYGCVSSDNTKEMCLVGIESYDVMTKNSI